MSYCAYITKIKNIRKHTNADRLLVGQCFGNNVIVSLTTEEDELGVYFPVDGKLCEEYCVENNLLRKKDENGNNVGGFLDPSKRKIQALKLRGEMSDGLFMPLKSLEGFTDILELKEGDQITVLNGLTICEKYVPKSNRRQGTGGGTKGKVNRKEDKVSFPMFFEHYDTSQLAYNTHAFREGDQCEITLKLHGTSQRTSYTLKETKKYIPYPIFKLFKLFKFIPKPKQTWEYVCGTRRVVLKSSWTDGYYGNNSFRQQHHEQFIGKLQKGETVYYEVVGYVAPNVTIMSDCSNKKMNDKEFTKQYGDTTRFTYSCDDGQSETYVYRMTMTNEDGFVVEYPFDLVKIRCEQMGVKHCPEFEKFTFTTVEDLMERVNKYLEGADPIGKSHVREGVVVRVANRERFTAYKHKSFTFKLLEGIIKDIADTPDMEEAQEEVA